MITWYVYIVELDNGSLYTGITLNVERRIAQHSSGKGSKYVRSNLPIKLLFYTNVNSKSEALKLEYKIKKMSHSQKLKFIKGRQ
jgi:putative endonuclease